MKRYTKLVIAAACMLLCSFLPPDEKSKVAINDWKYDASQFHADTSYWSNRNRHQIDFCCVDSAGRLRKIYIAASFNKWPVTAGTYKLVRFARDETEAGIYAVDHDKIYFSKDCSDCIAHVEVKDGKLHIWSDKAVMKIVPQQGQVINENDSTFFSFNLQER